MLITIITALLPIIVTLGLGLFAGYKKQFSQDQAQTLNKMVMLYTLPLMLFSGILGTPISDIMQNLNIFLWVFVGMFGGYILVFLISFLIFKSGAKLAALRGIAIAGPAVPFVGPSVLTVLFPEEASLAIATGGIIMNLLLMPFALVFLVGSGSSNNTNDADIQNTNSSNNKVIAPPKVSYSKIVFGSIFNAVKQPAVWAPFCAAILLVMGLDLSEELKGSFTLLGQATGGVSLFAVGAVLYAQKVSISLPVLVNVFCKNIVLPGVILGIMMLLSVSSLDKSIISVTLAIPTASIAVIFAVEYRVAQQEMASTLFISTILSVLTMGGFIWFTGG